MSTPRDAATATVGAGVLNDATDAKGLIEALPATDIRPFAQPLVDFFSDLSNRVVHDRDLARHFPDATAFGYWVRDANVRRLQQRFESLEVTQGGVRVPHGTSFHVAPGNVEALFAYSWAVAALCGNNVVVKTSSRGSGLTDALIAAIDSTVQEHPALADRWRFVTYPRERTEVTRALTSAADLLVFWGGDATVEDLRHMPSQPQSHTVAFPDRESLLLIRSEHYASLEDADRDRIAGRCADDLFTFGQAACSSPRYVVWVGEVDGATTDDLYQRMADHASRLADITATEVMNKRTYLYELAARGAITSSTWELPQWLVVRTTTGAMRSVDHPELGTIVEGRCDSLAGVHRLLRDSDQTVTHVGFDTATLTEWVRSSPPPWPKRLRPAGQAVDFDARWDGMDLLSEFTSLTTID